MTLEELKCTNCGAPLTNDFKCTYCGSVFYDDSEYGITPTTTMSIGLCAEDVARGLYRVIK